jgi:hypothetical protein
LGRVADATRSVDQGTWEVSGEETHQLIKEKKIDRTIALQVLVEGIDVSSDGVRRTSDRSCKAGQRDCENSDGDDLERGAHLNGLKNRSKLLWSGFRKERLAVERLKERTIGYIISQRW